MDDHLKYNCVNYVNVLSFQWARDQFEGLFNQTPANVNLFLR